MEIYTRIVKRQYPSVFAKIILSVWPYVNRLSNSKPASWWDSPWSLGKCIVGSQYMMIGDLSRPASRSKPLWKLGLLGRNETPDCTLPTTAAAGSLAVVLSESVRPPADLFTTIITTPQALNRNTHLKSSSFRYHVKL